MVWPWASVLGLCLALAARVVGLWQVTAAVQLGCCTDWL